jgi:hypothetical protein
VEKGRGNHTRRFDVPLELEKLTFDAHPTEVPAGMREGVNSGIARRNVAICSGPNAMYRTLYCRNKI